MWVDKYRPSTLCDIQKSSVRSHTKTANLLQAYLSEPGFNHILLSGLEGSGKKTFIKAIINTLFPGLKEASFLRSSQNETSCNQQIQISGLQSEHHIELDVSLLDTVSAQKLALHLVEARITTLINDEINLIIIKNVDHLLKVSQHSLLKLMEQNMLQCKFIISCRSVCKLIKPLRSRVVMFAIARPTNDELRLLLETILFEEQIKRYKQTTIDSIILFAQRNTTLAILSLQNCIHKDGFTISGWKKSIQNIVQNIVQSSIRFDASLNDARTSLEVLIDAGISGTMIVKNLLLCVLQYCNQEQTYLIIRYVAEYEHRMSRGQNPIFHLEALLCKVSLLFSVSAEKQTNLIK